MQHQVLQMFVTQKLAEVVALLNDFIKRNTNMFDEMINSKYKRVYKSLLMPPNCFLQIVRSFGNKINSWLK